MALCCVVVLVAAKDDYYSAHSEPKANCQSQFVSSSDEKTVPLTDANPSHEYKSMFWLTHHLFVTLIQMF
eukprot:m.334400 g.334400  ORF g.334400 m.334400 type:complete len:70 (-) comp16070_c2_seq4:25-234(-)